MRLSFLGNYPVIYIEKIATNICIVKIRVLMSVSLNFQMKSGHIFQASQVGR